MPTLVDLAGVALPERRHGRSFVPLLQSERYRPRVEIFGEMTYHAYFDPRRCVRTATRKLILNFTYPPYFMDPSQQWRPDTVTVDPPDPAHARQPVADPLETTNLAGAEPYVDHRRNLLQRLRHWMQETDDPLLDGLPIPPMYRRALEVLAEE